MTQLPSVYRNFHAENTLTFDSFAEKRRGTLPSLRRLPSHARPYSQQQQPLILAIASGTYISSQKPCQRVVTFSLGSSTYRQQAQY
eukprot:scaffold13358_cov198-Alexandrium_tamarense.AAC.6